MSENSRIASLREAAVTTAPWHDAGKSVF